MDITNWVIFAPSKEIYHKITKGESDSYHFGDIPLGSMMDNQLICQHWTIAASFNSCFSELGPILCGLKDCNQGKIGS